MTGAAAPQLAESVLLLTVTGADLVMGLFVDQELQGPAIRLAPDAARALAAQLQQLAAEVAP